MALRQDRAAGPPSLTGLCYNLKRVLNIVGVGDLLGMCAAIGARISRGKIP